MCWHLDIGPMGPFSFPWELLAGLVVWAAALVVTWRLLRTCLIADIGGNPYASPMRQFRIAIFGAGLWLAVTCVTAFYTASLSLGVSLGVGAAGPTILWFVGRVLRWMRPSKITIRENRRAVGGLQFSCQDLVVAVLCYGLGMALVVSCGKWSQWELLLWCAGLIPTQLLALFALADVRRWLPRPEGPVSRMVNSCSVHLHFMAFLPFAVAGWLMWRSVRRQVLYKTLQERS